MKIGRLEIHNFKSIRHMTLENIENALILVGKNNTGKTVVLTRSASLAASTL